ARHGLEDVVLVGFGSYRGSVIAGRSWGATMERMDVPPAAVGSCEDAFHRAAPEDRLLLMSEARSVAGLRAWRGHRAIGVVSNPENEVFATHAPPRPAARYAPFLYTAESRAPRPPPMPVPPAPHDLPETFPSGV